MHTSPQRNAEENNRFFCVPLAALDSASNVQMSRSCQDNSTSSLSSDSGISQSQSFSTTLRVSTYSAAHSSRSLRSLHSTVPFSPKSTTMTCSRPTQVLVFITRTIRQPSAAGTAFITEYREKSCTFVGDLNTFSISSAVIPCRTFSKFAGLTRRFGKTPSVTNIRQRRWNSQIGDPARNFGKSHVSKIPKARTDTPQTQTTLLVMAPPW